MSSAAKLRNRGIAVVGATALVMTSFGPAAFAWNTVTAGPSNTAGQGSIGLVDTDQAAEGTQGATAVTPAGSNQAVGDVRFVLPSTWSAGDTLTFTLAPDGRVGDATGADGAPDAWPATNGSMADAVTFSSTPAISIDSQARKADTHVADVSKTYTTDAAKKKASELDGATEGGQLSNYVSDGATTGPAPSPAFDVLPLSSSGGTGNGLDQVTIRFKENSAPNNATAKFVGTISGIKVDVGSNVAGQIALTASSKSATGAGTANFVNFAGETRATTYPAVVFNAALDVQNAAVVADGSQQNVGPLSVNAATGKKLGANDVTVKIDGATFVNKAVTATAYDAIGAVVSTAQVTPTSNNTALTYKATGSRAAEATKVVFSDPMVQAPESSKEIKYTLQAAGGLTNPTGTMNSGSAGHQTDIKTPPAITETQATATSLPDRIGGQDRYQTAVKIAERALGTDKNGPKGESDNVVIASGEGFADALSAGYLAATKNAQLILTRAGSLPQTDVEFLKTYGAKNVYVVGGNGSVSKTVEDQLRNLQSYDVQSATTSTNTQTSYTATFGDPAKNGFSIAPTSLSGLSTQPAGDAALKLTRNASGEINGLDTTPAPPAGWAFVSGTATSATLTYQGRTVTLTAPASSSGDLAGDATTNEVTIPIASSTQQTTSPGTGGSADTAQGANRRVVPLDAKLTVTRLAGNDRFETNRKVNEYAGATSVNPIGQTIPEYGKPYAKTALVVNGMAPWDALGAGPLVSYTGSAATKYPLPVVLTAGSTLNTNAKTQMQTLDVQRAVFIGGAGVLPDSLMGEADNLGAYTSRVAGADRWGTAKAVAEFALASGMPSSTNKFPGLNFAASPKNPILANGGSMNGDMSSAYARGAWADALAAGPIAAKQARVIALTDSRSLPGTTKDLLTANKAAFTVPVMAIGLGDVVSTETVAAANAALAK